MESDWQELNRLGVVAPTPVGALPLKPALSFDTSSELLWVGNDQGYVSSYNGPEVIRRYTSYRGHMSQNPAERIVRHIQTNDRGVVSLAATSLHFSSRGGLSQWNLLDERFQSLACMAYTSRGTSEVLVAGAQSQMFTVNLDRGAIAGEFSTDDEIKFLKRSSRHIVCGTGNGNARLLDMNSFQVVKEFEQIHSGGIVDMDTHDSLLVSCGLTLRSGTYMLDPLVKIYDLRMQRALPPVSFPGASFVRMHPKLSSVAMIANSTGQFQKVDLISQVMMNVYHANMRAYLLTAMELSPTGDCLAFTDNEGVMAFWGSPGKANFTEYANIPLDWPEPRTAPKVQFDDNTPLNTIGMPYYREELLSAWSPHVVYDITKMPQKIDADVLATATTNTGYAPYHKRHPRNYIERLGAGDKQGVVPAPKFLSQQARDRSRAAAADDVAEKKMLYGDETRRKFEVPPIYRRHEIKYSKFGVDDFDFRYYNETQYSGLETDISNSYMNPLLQLYRFTPRLRNVALLHTAGVCDTEQCTLCQMGYLFDMMEKASGQNCQATNFLRTLSTLQNASNIGVLEEDGTHHKPLTSMMQNLNRFLLGQTLRDHSANNPHYGPELSKAVELKAVKSQKCMTCKKETSSEGNAVTTDLVYSSKPANNKPIKTFAQTVRSSIQLETDSKGWCDRCRKYNRQGTRKDVRALPDILTFNATQDKNLTLTKEYWSTPGWLPQEIGMVLTNGHLFVGQGEEIKQLQTRYPNVKIYELVGFVADIRSEEDRRGHLISIINVGISSEQRLDDEDNWHLFNDFLVEPISQGDALDFTLKWKMPSVLCYQLKARHCVTDNSWRQKMDISILYNDIYHGHPNRDEGTIPLRPEEGPRKGTLVALDAEFVSLQSEETEVKADGEKEIVRPSRLGLARVSVLRGQDPDLGVPFLDDYIIIREPVVDFLTKYSGIQPGDLDPHYSRRPLVPMKIAYKRLWILLNLGCVFVGHGLPKDFRIINIHVPKEQVIDTVELWVLRSSQRKLSLKFLAWIVLKDFIQTDDHDSIEDARTALRLFLKYEEYRTAGVLEHMFDTIEKEGRKYDFKPPMSDGLAVPGKARDRLLAEDLNNPLPRSEAGTPQPGVGVKVSSG